jgi:hypothetical protein
VIDMPSHAKQGERPPARRPLQIFASDPMKDRTPGNRVTITIPNEEARPDPAGQRIALRPGPCGSLFEVVDFDGALGRYYAPVDLNDPNLLMQDGIDPSESDPRFHQQMVYAVGMKVVENVERALGRRFFFRGGRPLRLIPHAFQGANAFYDPEFDKGDHPGAVHFGYFRASKENPGENLPGQQVFTCLSHDIVCHEITHAIVDRLRPCFLEPTNLDVLAFHEGISDLVAIFQHFTFPDALRDQIRGSRGDVAAAGLVELAAQFGWATGSGGALRRALETSKPDPRLMNTLYEPHERGAILVAAVFDAFRTVYQRRTGDLRRIAGVEGDVAGRDLQPDLLDRLVSEATRTAQSVLTVCLRAFDYMPPVDPTFGDYLRALVTADFELSPDDDQGIRAAMIAAFRARGIYPSDVASMSQDSILWSPADPRLELQFPDSLVRDMLHGIALGLIGDEHGALPPGKERPAAKLRPRVFKELHRFATDHATALGLSAVLARNGEAKIHVNSYHHASRVGQDGRPVFELFVNFVQTLKSTVEPSDDFGGIPVRAGCTVVASASGRVRYVITKSFDEERPVETGGEPLRRIDRQREFVSLMDERDPTTPYLPDQESRQKRMRMRASLRSLHERLRP